MNDGKTDQSSLLFLLAHASATFRSDLDAAIGTDPRGTAVLARLHGGQRRLLTMIPPNGARGTDLAARAGITKQALGEFAAGLAEAGLLTAEADPTDRRARVWRLTSEGKAAAAAGRRALAAVESEWRQMLGARDYGRLVAILTHLHTRSTTID